MITWIFTELGWEFQNFTQFLKLAWWDFRLAPENSKRGPKSQLQIRESIDLTINIKGNKKIKELYHHANRNCFSNYFSRLASSMNPTNNRPYIKSGSWWKRKRKTNIKWTTKLCKFNVHIEKEKKSTESWNPKVRPGHGPGLGRIRQIRDRFV